jgi:hypothetical protein
VHQIGFITRTNLEDLILLVMFGSEDEGCAVLQSVGNCMPVAMP